MLGLRQRVLTSNPEASGRQWLRLTPRAVSPNQLRPMMRRLLRPLVLLGAMAREVGGVVMQA